MCALCGSGGMGGGGGVREVHRVSRIHYKQPGRQAYDLTVIFEHLSLLSDSDINLI